MKNIYSCLFKKIFFFAGILAIQSPLFAQESFKSISIVTSVGNLLPLWLWIIFAVTGLVVIAAIITKHSDSFHIIMKGDSSRKKKRIIEKDPDYMKE